jgi:hypothetical protein
MNANKGMRKILFLIILLLCGVACNRDDLIPDNEDVLPDSITDGFCISFGDSVIINHGDIESYDFSTHFVYLKEPHPLFEDKFNLGIANMVFSVYAARELIYSGIIFPAWASSIPAGPFILWPSFYPGYVIPINFNPHFYSTQPDTIEDPREDQRIVEALEKYGQLHPGLSLSIEDITIPSSQKVSFSYTVTNQDDLNYYILSPDKMGTGLFQYFTNGLYMYNQETGWLMHREEVVTPDPWDSWDPGWLELLSHHSSKTYLIEYNNFDEVSPGSYDIYFRFPGLTHVDLDKIEDSKGRIWLGELEVSEKVTVTY